MIFSLQYCSNAVLNEILIAVLHGHLWQCVEFQLEAGGQQVDIQTILKFKAKEKNRVAQST